MPYNKRFKGKRKMGAMTMLFGSRYLLLARIRSGSQYSQFGVSVEAAKIKRPAALLISSHYIALQHELAVMLAETSMG